MHIVYSESDCVHPLGGQGGGQTPEIVDQLAVFQRAWPQQTPSEPFWKTCQFDKHASNAQHKKLHCYNLMPVSQGISLIKVGVGWT